MSKPDILDEEPISMVEVKAALSKIKKRDGELSYRANKTEEYVSHFVKISQKKEKELKEKLENLKVPMLKEKAILKIIDIMPTTAEDVKLVLSNFSVNPKQDNLKKIAKTIESFV